MHALPALLDALDAAEREAQAALVGLREAAEGCSYHSCSMLGGQVRRVSIDRDCHACNCLSLVSRALASAPADLAAQVRARYRAETLREAADLVALLAADDEARNAEYQREHFMPGYMSTHRAAAARDAERRLRALADEEARRE